MADPTGGNQNKTGALKKSAPNVSSGWVVMLLSGLVAAVIFLFVTAQGTTKYEVLIASGDIQTGDKVDASSFKTALVNVEEQQLNRLISKKDAATYNGYVAAGPIKSGDLIMKSQLREASGKDGARRMSIPVDKTRAVNGNIEAGDRVDVIGIDKDNVSSYAVSNVEVLAVNSSGGSAISGSGSFSVTVAVSDEQALKLANAIQSGKFDIVKSTGAKPIDSSSTSTTPSA